LRFEAEDFIRTLPAEVLFVVGSADVIKAWPHAPVLTKPASPELILETVALQ
jgi:hypothetical protein